MRKKGGWGVIWYLNTPLSCIFYEENYSQLFYEKKIIACVFEVPVEKCKQVCYIIFFYDKIYVCFKILGIDKKIK